MLNKGFSRILLLVIVVFIAIAGIVMLGNYGKGEETFVRTTPNQPYENPSVSTDYSPTPLPSVTVEQITSTYNNPSLDFTFVSPITLYKYHSDNRLYGNELYFVRLERNKRDVPLPKDPVEADKIMNDNFFINFWVFDNKSDLPIKEFLAKEYNSPDITHKQTFYESFGEDLIATNMPIEGSFLHEGVLGENPYKTYFFSKDGKIYRISLGGGWGTGQKYSERSEKIFDQIISSIQFK